MKYIGASPKRLEDRVLLLGRGQYAADLKAPGQLHMRVVRSSVAHAKILGVDAAEARRHPGVVAVWTYDDVRHLPPIGIRLTRIPEEAQSKDKQFRCAAYFVGEFVLSDKPEAVVVAESPFPISRGADRCRAF